MFRSNRFSATPFLALLMAFLMTSCRTAQKYVESGDYDGAVNFCVSKLKGKKKKKDEYVRGLEVAFKKAQARDLNTAKHLAAELRPENWERINEIHRGIRLRQNKVGPLIPLVSKDGYRAKFEFVEIAQMEAESRQKAADYLYVEAESLLREAERGDRLAARKAHGTLLDLERRYFKNFRDKERLLQDARRLGTSHVLFEVKNQSGKILPTAFAERILAMGKNDLDSEWKAFHFQPQAGFAYDFKTVFRVRNIDISPERVSERRYTDEKTIREGWEYVLDERGNVKKDTNGNDIKIPRTVKIRADVLEVLQTKAARIAGVFEVFDAGSNALLDSENLSTEVVFENYASTFVGDRRALSEESSKRIGNSPVPFPRDEDLLTQTADRLKPNIRDEIRCCRAIF